MGVLTGCLVALVKAYFVTVYNEQILFTNYVII